MSATRPRDAYRSILCLVLVMSCSGLLVAAKKDKRSIEDGVLDRIELKTDALPEGAAVVIRHFDSSEADLGTAEKELAKAKEKDKNLQRIDAVRMMQNEGPRILAESIQSTLAEGRVLEASISDEEAPEGSIVVEGRFTMINPGSRAKRYWAGFGAGKSGIQVQGTVRTASGELLAEFEHMRHSGIGMGGGNYVKFLTDDTRDVGHDIAVFLSRWAGGGDLRKDAD